MSYSNSFPQQRPTLNLDFANSGKLDSRISFSRDDTPPTYAAPSAVHYWSNQQHLSSENLFPYSNAYDSSGWIKNRVDQTIGQTDPSGGTAAKLITQASGQTTAGVVYYTGTFGSDELTFSIYLKPNGRTKPNLSENLTDSGNTVKRTYFDLTGSGAVGTKDAAHTASIAKFGDWYRCTITFTPHAADSGSVYLYISDTDNSQTVADDGNGYIVYGANLSTTGQLVTNETSGSIHREYSSTLKSVSNAGAPRFEYDPTDGQSVGLLIEASATNLLTYSEDWANSDFTKFVAITSNAGIAPTGELAADLVTATSSAGDHITRQSLTVVSGQTYTMSVFAKASGCNFVRIGGASTAVMPAQASFDLVNGTVGTVDYGTAKIEDVGNGFYRCSVTGTAASNTSTHLEIRLMQSDNTPSWTGDDYSGLLLFGQMAEQSSSVSSYIKTTSSSVSRAADSCSVALSDINFTGGEVTLVADTNTSAIDDYRQAASIIDDSQNQVTLYGNSYNNRLAAILGGGENSTLSQTSANGISALSFGVNDIAATRNGASPVTDTSQAFPDVSAGNLKIGGSGSSQILNGTIKRVALYNVALSDTELQAITS